MPVFYVWRLGSKPAWSLTAGLCCGGATECSAARWICTSLLPCGKHSDTRQFQVNDRYF